MITFQNRMLLLIKSTLYNVHVLNEPRMAIFFSFTTHVLAGWVEQPTHPSLGCVQIFFLNKIN